MHNWQQNVLWKGTRRSWSRRPILVKEFAGSCADDLLDVERGCISNQASFLSFARSYSPRMWKVMKRIRQRQKCAKVCNLAGVAKMCHSQLCCENVLHSCKAISRRKSWVYRVLRLYGFQPVLRSCFIPQAPKGKPWNTLFGLAALLLGHLVQSLAWAV